MNRTTATSIRCRRAAVLIALSAWGPAGLLAQNWKDLGPAPISGIYTGRVSAIVCSPTDANRYLVAGADGGVWRTTDGGATWIPLTDDMPTSAMGALALDPTDENIIYAGTGEANFANHSRFGLGLFKSTDGGQTWVQLAEEVFGGRCFSSLLVDPSNPNVVYAAITRAGGFPEMAAAKGHPQREGPEGVFRSNDGGVTWVHLTNGLPALSATSLVMDPANPGVLYAGIGRIFGSADNGIYKTTNGGASWSKLGGGLPTSGVGRITVAVAPSNPQRLYALITRQADAFGGGASTLGGYRSDNGGTSWTQINVGNIQATYGWYLSVVSVSPSDPNTVFMGGLELVRSTNAGSSFSTVTPPHVDMHALAWDAAGRLVCGDDGGVHRTANLGGSWSSLNTGLGVVQFYAGLSTHPSDDTILFGGTQDNGSNRRNSDTRNWTQVFGGDGGWTQVDQANPLRVFVEYQGTGNLYRSTNGGTSFNYSGNGINAGDRNCFLPPYLIDPTNSNRMLYCTHRVYQSTNGGTSWSAISGDLTNGSPWAIRSIAMAPSDPNVVYVVTNDGNVQTSLDGGLTWTRVLQDVPGWPRVTRQIAVSRDDPLTVYLAVAYFGEQQVRRSRDGGQSWEPLDAGLPDIPVNTVAVDERAAPPVLYLGAEDGVYRSISGGGSWVRYGEGLPRTAVIDLRLEESRRRLIAATQGRGAWSIEINIPGDVNGDCVIDQADLAGMLAAFGTTKGEPDYEPRADFDGNGRVDQGDLATLLSLYGEGCR